MHENRRNLALLASFAALAIAGAWWITRAAPRRTASPAQALLRTHPWSSFPTGAWVDVHTHHVMTSGEGATPAEWGSDSRMLVGDIGPDWVVVRHESPAKALSESTSLVVPALEEFRGVRAVGQWPHDIFPMGPERQAGVTPQDKNPPAKNIRTQTLRTEQVQVAQRQLQTQVIEKRWEAHLRDRVEDHILTAWIAEGVELPLRWTLAVDGAVQSESELVSFEEPVDVKGARIPCIVTVTTKRLPEGNIVKRRWSSTAVPGFLVKMESRMESPGFSLAVNEWITGFQATATALPAK